MDESCIGTKTIVTIYLMNPTDHESSKNRIDENKLCGQTDAQPKSNVYYFGVPYADPISKYINIIPSHTTVCDGIIIYARPGDDTEVQLSLQKKIMDFCLEVKTFKNTIIFYEMSKTQPTLTEIPTLLISKKITGVTFLNILIDAGAYQIKTYTMEPENNIILAVPEHVHSKSPELVCTWWFQYYVGKVFGYGKGRLMQHAQARTCFINSVVNGIILSKDLSSMVLMYMNIAISFDWGKELLGLIKIGASADQCPSSGEILFLFRIMYSIYCKDIAHTRKQSFPRQHYHQAGVRQAVPDYVIPGEKIYSNLSTGEGGSPLLVIYKMLTAMNARFAVCKFSEFFIAEMYNGTPDNYVFYAFISALKHRVDPVSYLSMYDVILNISSGDPINIDKTIIIPGTIFDLQYCIISIISQDKAVVFNHAIVGYLCNGQPQTYDGATNSITFVDWTKLNTPEVVDAISKDVFAYRNLKPFPVTINTVFSLYLNRANIPLYTQQGICPA